MIIHRAFSMASHKTFTIKPIKELLNRYIVSSKNWFDPYAGDSSAAEITNDHNPEKKSKYHLEAVEFVEQLQGEFDGMIFDPPYSYRQVSEHYKVIGKKATRFDTSTQFYNRVYNVAKDKIKIGGHCISFGWNSTGMGKKRGFKIVEILLVNHGGHHNDTICTVETKEA